MPRGEVRIVVERELRCDRCGCLLEARKDNRIIWVTPC